MKHSISILIISIVLFGISCHKKERTADFKDDIAVIAYYSGNHEDIEKYPLQKLTHIIYSFLHLKGNKLTVDNSADSITIKKLVSLKTKHKNLKILLSLGGWGGCKSCSEVFSSESGRNEFAQSLKDLLEQFDADGIDLDWEYPAIKGFPGHQFTPQDKTNFTKLIQTLRDVVGSNYILSFAAGGFENFLENSIEWNHVMPLLDYVNIMSYDLVHGYSIITGHHCPLLSSKNQKESAEFAINFLDSIGVPKEKMVIGAAFYARIWEDVPITNHGLFQPGKFKDFICFNKQPGKLMEKEGFKYYWDSLAQAPYMYNEEKNLFATFDDSSSIALKTKYAIENQLGGIMFWELKCDTYKNGLLDVIDLTRNSYR